MTPFQMALCLAAALGLAGLLVARFVVAPPARGAAQAGVAASSVVGLLALGIKRLALVRGINYALGSVGATFVLRLLVLLAGLAGVRARGGDGTAFTLGFLAVFGVLLWVEVGYLAAAAKGGAR